METEKKMCKYCGKQCKQAPSQKERSKNSNRKLSGRSQCNSCAVTKRRWKSKLELVEMLGSKCSRCGWTGHPAGFQFHHREPEHKEFSLSGNKLLVKGRMIEVKKCELLCACCHSIEHANTELMKKMGLWQ